MSEQDWRELEAYRALGKPEELCKKQGWIRAKDKPPENENAVQVCYHFGDDTDMNFIGTERYLAFDELPHWQHESMGAIVTHWMPLPEPPKEGCEDG